MQSQKQFRIHRAFTAVEHGLSKHSHPADALQKTYRHLRGLPLHSFSRAQPLLLINSDYPHLITPIESVHLGPPGGLAALKTQLGWTLPFRNEKLITRSKQDTAAVRILEEKTIRAQVDGVQRYTTPYYGRRMSPLFIHPRSQCWVTYVGLKNVFPRIPLKQVPTIVRSTSYWMLAMSKNSPLPKCKPMSSPGTYLITWFSITARTASCSVRVATLDL